MWTRNFSTGARTLKPNRFLTCVLGTLLATPAWAGSDAAGVHWLAQEVEISRTLDALSAQAAYGFIVFRDVSVVDPIQGRSIAHRAVVVRDRKIAWTGDAKAAPDTDGAKIIDGRGLYLSPGLTDMHVHTVSLAEQVLRLAIGNTSVRDMDGFPWMLEMRRAVDGNALPAPTPYIAGTIIADQPLYGYVVVHSEAEARQTVRNEAACGYDFIKVHNMLAQPLFDAVADEARRAGLDLVGHIPHHISIDHAVHSAGMRTLEHLKGFIQDWDLQVSPEDYAKALSGAEVWLTPTFYVNNEGAREMAAQKLLALPEMGYVALRKRERWAAPPDQDWQHNLKNQPLFDTAQPLAMARLLPLHPHWLAGTDAAQYPLQVAGFALLDELGQMEHYGIARPDVIRAATTEPAAAMRRNDFGQIKTGLRADLVLLGSDPFKDLRAYRDNRGVVLRGHWFARPSLDQALAQLAAIEAEPDASFALSQTMAESVANAVEDLAKRHIALETSHVALAAAQLRNLHFAGEADRLDGLVSRLQAGPCRADTPD